MSEQFLDHKRFCNIEADLAVLEQMAYGILKKALGVQTVCMENTTLLDDARHELYGLKSRSEELISVVNRCMKALG